MKNSAMLLKTSFTILALLCIKGSAIQCHVCQYSTLLDPNSTCRGPDISSSFLTSCGAQYSHCQKTQWPIDIDSNTAVVNITRRCRIGSSDSNSCRNYNGYRTCWCNSDKCNGSHKANISLLVVFLTMIVSVKLH